MIKEALNNQIQAFIVLPPIIKLYYRLILDFLTVHYNLEVNF